MEDPYSIYMAFSSNCIVGLSTNDELLIQQLTGVNQGKPVFTGIKTKAQLKEFQGYLDRLSIHLK